MNENVNLCKLLEGHEGETFYTPLVGNVKFEGIDATRNRIYCLHFDYISADTLSFTKEGKYHNYNSAECLIFPSKDQRDWNKWAEEQKPKIKIPKTWSELITANVVEYTKAVTYSEHNDYGEIIDDSVTGQGTPIEKSDLALLKIHQLIEVGYGGNVTNEEWENNAYKYVILCGGYKTLSIESNIRNCIAFHTRKQAAEFLSYPENVQLIRDFYMI